ncbi:hypothetical protein N6G95_09645 [Pediococcus inopinatus]|uniref:hypothetical protein n=1 Tax=Pediococcus inopinatus TaxID=114090 RepID=UPI002B258E14|nr:hypothetical protein [Pediococcus inopinatus]WPC19466.1 hypothetical protein N6G95_09645 [Pediococcus inopinatus]
MKFTDEQNNTIKRTLAAGVSFDKALEIAAVDLSDLDDKGEKTPAVVTPLHVAAKEPQEEPSFLDFLKSQANDDSEDDQDDGENDTMDKLSAGLTGILKMFASLRKFSDTGLPATGEIKCDYDDKTGNVHTEVSGRPDILLDELTTAYKTIMETDSMTYDNKQTFSTKFGVAVTEIDDEYLQE